MQRESHHNALFKNGGGGDLLAITRSACNAAIKDRVRCGFFEEEEEKQTNSDKLMNMAVGFLNDKTNVQGYLSIYVHFP